MSRKLGHPVATNLTSRAGPGALPCRPKVDQPKASPAPASIPVFLCVADVQGVVLPQIFNLCAGLSTAQQDTRRRIRVILQGNARAETHAVDASHLAEAVETGCGFFIAPDKRFFKKRDELRQVLPPSLNVVTLEEFFEIFDDYKARRPR
jgi:hypothetical protein